MECGGVSFLLQIFPPKKRNICTAFYNFLCGIHQKRDSLVFYSCGKYRNSLMFSVLEPAPLSVWNLHHFPSGICIPFPLEPVSISLWNLLPSPLESASLSIQNLPRFPLESASLLSGICIALPLEPASLSVWNLHPFPLARPRPVCRPRPPRACCIFFAGFPLAQTTQRQKKKDFSLSHWLKNRASSDPKFASFIGFFVRGLCSCRVFLGRPEAFCESRKGGVQGNKNSELQQ